MKMTINTVSETQFGVWKAEHRPNTEDKDLSMNKQKFSNRNQKTASGSPAATMAHAQKKTMKVN